MTAAEKRGAILFFGEAGCVSCHAVSGRSNEMFSDFRRARDRRAAARSQRNKQHLRRTGGERRLRTRGLHRQAGRPLRLPHCAAQERRLSPAFMHDGAFTSLEAAIRHHLDVVASARSYNPAAQGSPQDLRQVGPVDPILALLDPLVATQTFSAARSSTT